MVGGQYADVSPRTPSGPQALRRLHELKTGRLIGASVLCVLRLAGIEDGPATIEFRRFAAELGVLFQIVDDILDVTGTDDALGKPQGSDERHGKRTYVSEFGIERARELAAESHRTARQALAAAAAQIGPGGGDRRARADHGLHLHPHLMSKDEQQRPQQRLLAQIDGPEDLHGLSDEQLSGLAQEVREHIIDTVGEIGGHFGANLGTCELAVALHSVLESPKDKILWDVGHQAYPHKILTGRRDRAEHDPPVRGARPVLLDRGVPARHHGRRARLDLDRLRGRDQGGHAPRGGRAGEGRGGDRRRRDDRRASRSRRSGRRVAWARRSWSC